MESNSNKTARPEKKRSKGAKIVLWALLGCFAVTLIVMAVMLIIAACGGTGTSNGSLLGLQFDVCTTVLGFFAVALVLAWLLTEPSFKKEEEVFETHDIYQSYVKKASTPRPVKKEVKAAPVQEEVKEEAKEEEAPAEEAPAEEAEKEEEASPVEETAEDASADDDVIDDDDDDEDDDEDEEDDDSEDDDDVDTPDENSAAGLFIGAFVGDDGEMYRYRRSFMSRIIQASDNTKGYYTDVKNKLLSYKNVKSRTSWGYETFNLGRKRLARMNVRGKTLVMYLALEPAEYIGTKYHIRDVSDKAKYASVPVMVRVKSPRGSKFALELIEQLMEKQGAVQNPKYSEQSFALEFRDNDALVSEGLVKVVPVKNAKAVEEKAEPVQQ